MQIKKLKLRNFRNYEELDIDFSEKINILIGDNAQGKTNILEAIYLCATGRTHKTSKDLEIKKFDSDNYYVKIDYDKDDYDQDISIAYSQEQGKIIKINEIAVKKLKNLIGNLIVIIFSPEDLNIIKGSPSDRRRFIDMTLSQIKVNYFSNLQEYQKILKQRNALLKSIQGDKSMIETLDIWDKRLVQIGAFIIKERIDFIEKLNNESKIVQNFISCKSEEINLTYDTKINIKSEDSIEKIERSLFETLREKRSYDILRKTTTVGPHRDDLLININHLNIKIYGSQGQQRTTILSIILAKLAIIKNEIGQYPILLLDDVTSELDNKRISMLLSLLKDVQTFITTTDLNTINIQDMNDLEFRVFKIKNGKVAETDLKN